MTLDILAQALRGVPRGASILVRLPDGNLGGIRLVRAVHLGADGQEATGTVGTFDIVLEAESNTASG